MRGSYNNFVASRSFRIFALLGLHRRHLSPFDVYETIRGYCPSRALAFDMLAVYDTLRLLELDGKEDCVAAVRGVYFGVAARGRHRNDVTFRVRRIAFERHCDERTIFRHLATASELYMKLRQKEDKYI